MTAGTARPGSWVGAALLATAFGLAQPVAAARIVLIDGDGPGEGFNDPTPVARVVGNPATTLGAQRRRVFEATAWRLGTMIASPAEIRVEASWDSLECGPTEGTLAAAGPSFVFRDFPGAPRGATWYAAALADALAGEDLSAEDNEMSVTFNEDVGSASCLSSREWDYRIGVSGGSDFSMERVLFHELAHGLGFTSLVDTETGEKFQGFDDAFMANLEDHARGRRWNALSASQRLESSTRTGLLHWLGGNALAHAVRLRGGTHASGHPQMYAPRPFEDGSSVSHWDIPMTLNVDEFMEPFATRTSGDLLTGHALQDLGWKVNRSGVGWVEDQNANGSVEVAVLRVADSSPGHEVVLLDSSTGETIRRIRLPPEFAALDLTVLPHHAGPPASEIAVLLWRPQGGAVAVAQFDASTGEEVRRLNFPSGSPMRLVTVPDYAGSTAAELMVVGLRAGTGARIWIKDARTGRVHAQIPFTNLQRPVDVAVLDSFGGSNAPEIALLLAIPSWNRSEVQVRDARSGALLTRIALPTGRVYQSLRALGDFGGAVGSGELATVSVDRETGRPRLAVFDAETGEWLSGRTFFEAFEPVALEVLPSFAGTLADEILLWTRRTRFLIPRGHVVDAGSMVSLGAPRLGDKHLPLAVGVLPNVGGSGAADTVVVTSAPRDRLQRAFLIDGRGGQIRGLILP